MKLNLSQRPGCSPSFFCSNAKSRRYTLSPTTHTTRQDAYLRRQLFRPEDLPWKGTLLPFSRPRFCLVSALLDLELGGYATSWEGNDELGTIIRRPKRREGIDEGYVMDGITMGGRTGRTLHDGIGRKHHLPHIERGSLLAYCSHSLGAEIKPSKRQDRSYSTAANCSFLLLNRVRSMSVATARCSDL